MTIVLIMNKLTPVQKTVYIYVIQVMKHLLRIMIDIMMIVKLFLISVILQNLLS